MARETPADLPLSTRVQQCWERLSETERRLAQVVTQPGFTVASYTARELAEQARVSPAAAARLFRKLGYRNFHELRRQQRALPPDSPLARSGGIGRAPRARRDEAWASHLQGQAGLLEALQGAVSAAQIDQAAQRLRSARRVFVLGLRASHVPAVYAQALWSQLRPDVFLLADGACRPSELLCELRRGDCVVAMDFRRRSSQLLPWLRAAKGQGAQLLLCTDTAASDLVGLAELSLCCPHPRHQVFDSHLAVFALIHYLAVVLAERDARGARQRLAGIERLHRQLADLAIAP